MDGSDGPIASSSRSPASRLTRIHFTEEAGDSLNLEDSPGTQFKASRTTKRLTLMSALPIDNNMGARRRISSGPESRPSQPRRRKAASTSPSQKRYLFDQDSGFDSGPSKLNAFSDEYDLSHEDPKILQDVQRALKLKARREARLKLESRDPSQPSTASSWSSQPIRSLPVSAPSATSFPKLGSQSSEIDFSPSTSAYSRVGLHPVPTSIDDGLSLDWSCPLPDEERTDRRWTMSMTRRKGKERSGPISATTLDAQESRYTARLSRIKTVASPQTLRKRAIIADQLERQYRVIFGNLASPDRFNILKVSRWYGSQETIIRSSLEKAEPFTWLKHLDLRGSKGQLRMPWHLTALVMEEYIQANCRQDRIVTIIEDPNSPPSPGISPYPTSILPGFPFSSRMSSRSALGPSLTRYQSNEGRVSFEPLIEGNRDSLEVASHKSGDSTYSSISHHHPPPPPVILGSPASSLLNIAGPSRKYRDHFNDSDEGSSAPDSISGRSDDNGHFKKPIDPSKGVLDRTDALHSPSSIKLRDWSSRPSSPSSSPRALNMKTYSLDGASNMFSVPKIRPSPLHSRRSSTTNVARLDRLRARTAGSGPGSSTVDLDNKRRQDEVETQRIREHELKSQLLKETTAQNTRMRQLLNRIAAGVREYDLTQSSLASLLEVPINNLPPELLDAFSHDPSVVTGATRRLKGWRAVEDIHYRILRQRAIFEDFLSRGCDTASSVINDTVVRDPVSALHDVLITLRERKAAIAMKADAVAEALASVQTTHRQVKMEYNEALAHTSAVYPEISRIVALEESYKDSYQQFWEMGMDALTLLLDSVTPFWRTYGKTIGEDVQDFLIIPLYRHEFTGEAKRYLIESLPTRSLRHWAGLVLFFYGAIAVVILQVRAAIASSMYAGLPWIEYDVFRWIALPFFGFGILVQWIAVIVEFFIVMAQIGVIVWWVGWAIRLFS